MINPLRSTIKDMQELAKKRGGRCLSKKYVNSGSKLLWQCKEGHKWKAVPGSITMGTWCPYCAGVAKYTLKDMQRIATERDGKCLSEKYINSKSNLKWQCKEGHIWLAIPNNIKRGTWCPRCAWVIGANKRRASIGKMQKLARNKEGVCLSKIYINNNNKLLWQCKFGHKWLATPGNIKSGKWCPYCANRNRWFTRRKSN